MNENNNINNEPNSNLPTNDDFKAETEQGSAPYSQSGTGQYGNSSGGTYSYTPNTNFGSSTVNTQSTAQPQKRGVSPSVIVVCILLSVLISVPVSLVIAFGVLNGNTNDTVSNTSSTSSVASTGESDENDPTSSTVISIEGNVESLVEAVYEKSGNCVVGIRTTASVQNFFGGSSDAGGEGSGVIYTTDGYIITNYHVIENVVKYQSGANTSIEVFFPSDPDVAVGATIIGYNISADLAVIKIDRTGLPAIEIGNSEELKVGQYAIAIGCPGGLQFIGSVSYGIISGLNRTMTVDSIGEMKLIQTDAAINPGNSGGALLNSNGQLIGISSSKLVNTSYEGMGFAIPVNTVVEVVKDILDNKDNPSPYIGIEIYKYKSDYLEKYGLPHGAAVKSVVDGGPAYEAKLRAGDIITEFNSTAIDEYTDFIDALDKCTPGTKVTVKIYRNGKYYSTTVEIGSNNSR